MKPRVYIAIGLLGAAVAGCSSSAATSAAGSSGGYGGGGGKYAGTGGAWGAGGMIVINMDAAILGSDAVGPPQAPNLSPDAVTFNWDTRTCTGCDMGGSGGGAAGSPAGGRTGGGGSGVSGTGTGGSTGTTSKGGSGGSAGAGGYSSADAGLSMDALRPADAAGVDGGGTGADAPVVRLDAGPDLTLADTLKADTSSGRCVAQIRALVPSTDSLAQFPLVAGTNTQVVLRAEVVSGGPAAPTWTWQASRDNTAPIPPSPGTADPAAAAFAIAKAGSYSFTAQDQTSCVSTVRVTAVASDACAACDHSVILRAAPPPGGTIPVQSGAIALVGSTPFSQTNVVLAQGVPVTIAPSVASNLVRSYVRINNPAGDLVADGLADPTTAGFRALLLAMDNNRAVLRYDVLVVPMDGVNVGTVAATAPQLFSSLTPDQIKSLGFGLSGGVTVTGGTFSGSGQGVADARIILTNRDPKAPAQPSDLIFSSVGRGDPLGSFELHAQPGQYWVSVSPPAASTGLAEALAPDPITLSGPSKITFQWNPIVTTPLTLIVRDASGDPNAKIDGARVRLTTSQTATVGIMTIVDAAGTSTMQAAQGNVRVEDTTASGGTVTFNNLPTGTYDVLIVPAPLGPYAATTMLTVTVSADRPKLDLQTLPQGRIAGKLLSSSTADWSKVNLVAYDRSADSPESPRAVSVSPDGSFAIGASPGRLYVVVAVPDTSTNLARTFVGPGPLEATEFSITQKVQDAMPWSAMVIDETSQGGLGGTALQAFCGATWPNCIDPTIPLAETTSEDGGTFQLALPNPSTR